MISDIGNITFDEAWKYKNVESVRIDHENIRIYFIGLNHLIENKQMIARPKDLQDLKYLKVLKAKRKPKKAKG